MHLVLEIPELLLVIIDFLSEKISDTYHLGRTCRSIWGVVEPVIWRDHANAAALRSLMPEDIITDFGQPPRPLSDLEWSRLSHYGTYIYSLELSELSANRIREWRVQDVLILLRTHPDPHSLLPHLRSLYLGLYQRHSLDAAVVLVSLLLKRLFIRTDIREHIVPSVIKTLIEAIPPGPNMEELSILLEGRVLVDAWANRLDTSLATLLPQLPRLRMLHLKMVTDGLVLMPSLASLRALQSLEIVITSDNFAVPPYDLPPTAFPALRCLMIDSEESFYQPSLLRLLQSISSTNLEKLYFYCEDRVLLADVLLLLSSRWRWTLASLRISMSFHDEPSERFRRIFFGALAPLLQCSGMQDFILISDVFIPWDDERLEELASAWPRLRVLWIDDGWAASQRISPAVTRASLALLATECPHLTHLRISVDYNLPPVTIDWRALSICPLAHLHTDYSRCSNPVAAADFIRDAFPLLEGLTADGSGMIPVAELLRLSQAADPPPFQIR